MFYAHFVLSKKGPLARIWLAAHWDKKLTKAHVFETNIDSSVEAILQPKVKMALRTSGHLLLGVVRIYSRKAKYLLADCNEAFVKIKMAFRPGVVDLPEENREAAVAAITLQENFHDFEATLADLEDIDVQAQFSVNQSRPEDITMREDLGSIPLMGDDGFGDVGFDEREYLRGATHLDDPLFKSPGPSHAGEDRERNLEDNGLQKMDLDMDAPVQDDGFGGVADNFMEDDPREDDDDDDDNADGFGDVDGDDFFGEGFMQTGVEVGGGLFEDTPMPEVPLPPDVHDENSAAGKPEEEKTAHPAPGEVEVPEQQQQNTTGGTTGEQTTLVPNEQEAFALEPLEVTAMPGGGEKKGKRKRKLIVDEQKGIPSETMKLQLADTSDIVTTLDLAPPTKKLMHWKETGGVEKLFALPGRAIISKVNAHHFTRNLITRPMKDEDDGDGILDVPETVREDERLANTTRQSEMSTIVEEQSIAETSTARSKRGEKRDRRSEQVPPPPPLPPAQTPAPVPTPLPQELPVQEPLEPELAPTPLPEPPATDLFGASINESLVDLPNVADPMMDPNMDDGPPSIAPFSVPPPSVPPAAPTFDDIEADNEQMPETEEQEENRTSKRTQQMQNTFEVAFQFSDTLSFKEMARKHNRKQAASRFYTLLVLKKHQAIDVEQREPYGDIYIRKGPNFGIAC